MKNGNFKKHLLITKKKNANHTQEVKTSTLRTRIRINLIMVLTRQWNNVQTLRENEFETIKLPAFEKEGKEHAFILDLRKYEIHRM